MLIRITISIVEYLTNTVYTYNEQKNRRQNVIKYSFMLLLQKSSISDKKRSEKFLDII